MDRSPSSSDLHGHGTVAVGHTPGAALTTGSSVASTNSAQHTEEGDPSRIQRNSSSTSSHPAARTSSRAVSQTHGSAPLPHSRHPHLDGKRKTRGDGDQDHLAARVLKTATQRTPAQAASAARLGGKSTTSTRSARTTMGLGLLHPFTRPLAYYLVHSWRVYGFLPALGYGAITRPLATFLATLAFLALRLPRDSRVAKLVHAFAAYGSSGRPRFVRAQKEPYTKAYFWPEGEGVAEDVHGVKYEWRAGPGGAAAAARRDDEDKEQIAADEPEPQYIVSLHPHGILCCGWFNLIGRFSQNWSDSDRLDLMDRLKLVLCFAPAVQHMPLHGDMYRQNCSDATSGTLARILSDNKERKSVAIAPGGFSEACYTGASENQEVAYLLERYGFIKLAIEQNVDIIPVYSFGNDAMYRSWDLWGTRHRRAVYAQKMGVPLVFWDGWDGLGLTNIPKTEDVVTVSFDPFRIGKYRQEWLQLELEVQDGTAKKNGTNAAKKEALVRRCHFDYLKYLAKRFEEYKSITPSSACKELVFMGKNSSKPLKISEVQTKFFEREAELISGTKAKEGAIIDGAESFGGNANDAPNIHCGEEENERQRQREKSVPLHPTAPHQIQMVPLPNTSKAASKL